MSDQMPVFIPEKIDLEDILLRHPPSFKFSIDNFKYFIHLLVQIPSIQRKNDDAKFTQINAQKLQKVIRNYAGYKKYLLEVGIVEEDGKIKPYEKSNGYRIADFYLSKARIEYITDRSLVKKLKKKTIFVMEDTNLKHLSKWFRDGLELDYEMAVDLNERQFQQNLNNEPLRKTCGRFNSNFFNIEHLREKNFWLKRDTTSFRVHHNLTCLGKTIRGCLAYEGKPLIWSDLKSSQPFFLSLFLKKEFYQENKSGILTLKRIQEYKQQGNAENQINATPNTGDITHTLTLCSLKPDEENDIARYIDTVQYKDFYNEFGREIELKLGKSFPRDILKTICYRVLYSHPRRMDNETRRFVEVFKAVFPNVYRIIEFLKMQNYKFLAIIMQSIESYIFIEKISHRIALEFPELPFFTVHDCIASLSSDKEIISQIIIDEIHISTGLNPKLEFKSA